MSGHRRVGVIAVGLMLMGTMPGGASAAGSGDWEPLGHGTTTSSVALVSRVDTFTRVGNKLYVGGQFTNAGGVAAADYIAVWSGTSWHAVGAGITDGGVFAIAVDGNKVYAGGSFRNASGHANADHLAVWDGSSWHAVGGVAPNADVNALAIVGRTLYVGGAFDNAAGIPEADSVAAVNLDTGAWSAVTDSNRDIGGTTFAIAPDGTGGVYIGGYFIDVDGIAAADGIAHYTGGTTWSAVGGGLNGVVRSITVHGGDVYAGGDFTDAGNEAGDKVARFNGSSWSGLGATSAFGEGSVAVYDVVLDGSRVYAVGTFLNVNGNPRADAVATFDGASWTNVGSNASGTNGPGFNMRTVEVVGPRLYVGGLDSAIGGGSKNAFAAFTRLRQPDAAVKTTGAYVGTDVYRTSGSGETKSATVHRGNTVTFTIRITNDGLSTDSYHLAGPGSGGGFSVHYRSGTTDVTSDVVGGTWSTGNLSPGAHTSIKLLVKVGTRVHAGTTRSWLVRATSAGAGAAKDAVKASVKAS